MNMDETIQAVNALRGDRIQWKKEDKTFADLYTQIKQGRFNLDPEHQRHVVHNDSWKSEVLHSQIYHGDIPDVYFHPAEREDGTRRYDSLDGKQRCSAIYDYLNDDYSYKMSEPVYMYKKKFSELTPAVQSFLRDDCTLTTRISNRPLTPKEIQSFFQKRQDFKKTSGGEHLNSCITSHIHHEVKSYIETEENIRRLESAGFKKNDRHQYIEAVSYMLRVYNYHKDNNIDCSPSNLKRWFNGRENPLGTSSVMAFNLVNITLDLLENIKVCGGNTRKNAYISCAWYVMNYCFEDGEFNIKKISSMKKDISIDLPTVDGDHSNKRQRAAFKAQIEA